MANQDQTYRSLVMRKVQQLAKEHGGLAKIPKSIQQKLGFDVIAKRKGTSISVRIPPGDLASRIAELKKELPKVSLKSAKPAAETIFGKYTPVPSLTNPTMDDFWILQGWYKDDRIGIKLTLAKWQDDEKVQRDAIRFLVDRVLKKTPRDIAQGDFHSNRLSGLLSKYYKNSPYEALLDAGYAYSVQESIQHSKTGTFQTAKLYPWEMQTAPNALYNSKENRVAATKWLAWKLKRGPSTIIQEDFYSNRLCGLISNNYEGSPYKALLEAGYIYSIQESLEHARIDMFYPGRPSLSTTPMLLILRYDVTATDWLLNNACPNKFYPWEMSVTPTTAYDSKEKRAAATKWLLWKLKKHPRDITGEDFYSNQLAGMLSHYYKDSPYAAVTEAGYQLHPWEMQMTSMGFYEKKENRVAATKWLIAKLKKDPRDIMKEDFELNRLAGLLHHHYKNSPYAAVLEAGYQFHPWEMQTTPQSFYQSRKNRAAATNWLVQKLGKSPMDISAEDFISNRLAGMLFHYYQNSPYEAFVDVGYAYSIKEFLEHAKTGNFQSSKIYPWEMAVTPADIYKLKENRVAAVKWLSWKLKKDPRGIIGKDFESNSLAGLLVHHYNNSPYEAILEAGLVTPADEGYMRSPHHTHGGGKA